MYDTCILPPDESKAICNVNLFSGLAEEIACA
jgi:hypothetical protein